MKKLHDLAKLTLSAAVFAGFIFVNPVKSEDLKVGFIYIGPTGDHGWTYEHDQGRKAIEKALGSKVKTTYVEKVPESADAARVLTKLASSGHGLIFTTSFGYMNPTLKVAKKFPKVKFEHATGYKRSKNVSTYSARFYEGRHVAGLIAGKMTKTNILGVVAAMPIPEVNRLSNAFCSGAKEVNKNVRCKFSFIGSFFDPPKAKEAALAQIEAGADVLYAERFGVIEACNEKGVLAISNMSDQSSLGPDTVITGPVWDMWPTIKHVVTLVKAGVPTAQDFGGFSYMGKGGSYLAPYHNWDSKLPASVKAMVEKRKAEMLDGTFRADIDESAPKSD